MTTPNATIDATVLSAVRDGAAFLSTITRVSGLARRDVANLLQRLRSRGAVAHDKQREEWRVTG